MTVKELIEELKMYPEDMRVRVEATYDLGYGLAGGKFQYIKVNKYANLIILGTQES